LAASRDFEINLVLGENL